MFSDVAPIACDQSRLGLALYSNVADMLRTVMQAGAGCLSRRVVSGGVNSYSQAGRRMLSSLQEALVKVTFIDPEVSSFRVSFERPHSTSSYCCVYFSVSVFVSLSLSVSVRVYPCVCVRLSACMCVYVFCVSTGVCVLVFFEVYNNIICDIYTEYEVYTMCRYAALRVILL